jgi:hypothetical protein
MIQKARNQTKTPPSTGDKKASSRNTAPPLPSEEHERRERLYADSRVFSNELTVVVGDLYNASAEYRDDIFEFLKWFHPDRCRSQAIATRIRACLKPIRPALEHYVAFAFRFRVWLHGMKTKDGRLRISPVFEGISGPHLDAKLRKGALVPPKNDDDRFAESNETGEHYEDYRFKLVSKAVGDEIGPVRLLRFGVAENRDSELMHILNSFYDPLELNFVEVQRRISGKQTQNYLMCIVGELSDGRAWRKAGSVRTQMIKRVYGVSTRGRKSNFDQRARDMVLVAKYGSNVKASANASIEQRGQNPAFVPDNDFRRVKQRMLRATRTHQKLTSHQN